MMKHLTYFGLIATLVFITLSIVRAESYITGINRIINFTCSDIKPKIDGKEVNGRTLFADKPQGTGYIAYFVESPEKWEIPGCTGKATGAPQTLRDLSDLKTWINMGNFWTLLIKPRWWYDSNNEQHPIYTKEGNDFSDTISDHPDAAFPTWLRESGYTITNEPGKIDFTASGKYICRSFQECGKKWVDTWLGGTITVSHWLEWGIWNVKAYNALGAGSWARSVGIHKCTYKQIHIWNGIPLVVCSQKNGASTFEDAGGTEFITYPGY